MHLCALMPHISCIFCHCLTGCAVTAHVSLPIIFFAAVDNSNQEPAQTLYQICLMYHELLPSTLPFPVQVRWAKWSLERVRVKAGRGEAGRSLEHGDVLAHQLSHFVNTLHQFVMDRLLHGAWLALEQVSIVACILLNWSTYCPVHLLFSCSRSNGLFSPYWPVNNVKGMTSSVKQARQLSLDKLGMVMSP